MGRLTSERVLQVLRDNPGSTMTQLSELLGVSRKSVENHLLRQARRGRARSEGPIGSAPGTFSTGTTERKWYAISVRRVASIFDLGHEGARNDQGAHQ